MADQAQIALVDIETPALPEPHQQLQQRHHEGAEEHQRTPAARGQRLPAAQAVQRLTPRALLHRAGRATGTTLAIEHQHHRQQQQTSQLGRALQAVEAVPGLVDGGGEGIEVEGRHRAEVGQSFHNRQRQTGTDSRSRHRQGHPPEGLPGRQPQHPCRLHQTAALSQESAAGEQIDVGVEHQYQHHDHAAGGAHPRQSEPAAEPLAQQRLHRAGEVQETDKDERQHIGRNGKGQHQRPVQPAPPREFAQRCEPGQAHPEADHAEGHPQHQGQGVAQQARQLGIPQVRPDRRIHLVPGQQHDRQRQQHQQGNGGSNGVPAALGGMGHARSSARKHDAPA